MPEQGITLAEAVRAYTINVAFANGLEDQTGSIRAGKSADLVVIDKDIFALPTLQISDADVLVTLFQCREVFGSLESLKQP